MFPASCFYFTTVQRAEDFITFVLVGLKDYALKRFSSRPSFAGLFRALQAPCGVASISWIRHGSAPQICPILDFHSCASSHVLVLSLNTGNLFLLLKPCHLVTGIFWGAMDSFACLFDVFYYSESTAMMTISTIFDSGLDPEHHKHASYTKETWNPY